MKFAKTLLAICVVLLPYCGQAQTVDTVRFIYETSKDKTALFSFTREDYNVKFGKGQKVIKGYTDVPLTANNELHFIRQEGRKAAALLKGDRRLATYSGDTVVTSSGKYFLVIYSHLKWSYRKDGEEVLVCRYFSEKKKKNVMLNFLASPNDREVLMLVALEQARWMISKQGRLSNEGRLFEPPTSNYPAPYSSPAPVFPPR